MAIDDQFSQPIKLDELLLSKHLEPLAAQHVATLDQIASLDVISFNEAEVRSNIIDPIVRLLGYGKGTTFSVDLEHPLKFLDKNLFPNYQLTLWTENFWLIEAKRPRFGLAEFEYDDLAQAVEYSIHPKVNAALVVLCDGLKIEVFDREVSVEEPTLRVAIRNLTREFDKLRALLDPMQVWFFQKRRVVRLLDKVFDKEFNMYRVEEFSRLVERRLRSKQQLIVENFRATIKPDTEEAVHLAETASIEELTELYLFSELPIPITNAVNRRLVTLSQPSSFQTMYRIFPDRPRDTNDIYMAQAVSYLMRLGEHRGSVEWLPAWLTQGGPQSGPVLEGATKFLLKQCLTYFEDYEPYRLVLLAACAVRRIAKFMAITNHSVRQLGTNLHALARHHLPEISWNQIVASPESQLIGLVDRQTRAATLEFVKGNSSGRGAFQPESAKMTLKGYWQLEEKLLAAVPHYPALLRERSLGDMRMIEWSSVTYDNLGHATLCLMHPFPHWKAYVLDTQKPLIESLARLGSWSAKKMLDVPMETTYEKMSDPELAKRFFLGDEPTLQALRTGYQGTGKDTQAR